MNRPALYQPHERHDSRLRVSRPAVHVTSTYPPGHQITEHVHSRSQLLMLRQGSARITTSAGSWVATVNRGVWIAAEQPHSVQIGQHPSVMRSVYFDPSVADTGASCCAIHISDLLHALINEFSLAPALYELNTKDDRLVRLMIDCVLPSPIPPVPLPTSKDPRLRRLMQAILENPADDKTLRAWGNLVGASEKTLTRMFLRDTKIGFRQWRGRVRALKAIELLTNGLPVTEVAAQVGYESTSAFLTMFRQVYGLPPSALCTTEPDRPYR